MALIKPQGKLSWDASLSSDVEGYRLYQGINGQAPDYDSPYADVGNVLEVSLPVEGLPAVEGEVIFGVAAVDGVGNISDIRLAAAVLIDVTAPEAPQDLIFTPFF